MQKSKEKAINLQHEKLRKPLTLKFSLKANFQNIKNPINIEMIKDLIK
jgi:hypothetical protein